MLEGQHISQAHYLNLLPSQRVKYFPIYSSSGQASYRHREAPFEPEMLYRIIDTEDVLDEMMLDFEVAYFLFRIAMKKKRVWPDVGVLLPPDYVIIQFPFADDEEDFYFLSGALSMILLEMRHNAEGKPYDHDYLLEHVVGDYWSVRYIGEDDDD